MKHAILILLQLASGGSDAYFTNRNAHGRHFVEHDFIARPFVANGTLERGAYFGVNVGAAIVGAELLAHTGHQDLALALRAGQIADNGICATYSAKH